MRIAVCGGSFDPFHRGHLEPVLAVRDRMGWDRVIYVPAWRQPFKADRDATSGYHRFAMAVLATHKNDIIYISPIELERGGTSYSVETLEVLHDRYPKAEIDWIIGDDNVTQLGQWKRIDRILHLFGCVHHDDLHADVANGMVIHASRAPGDDAFVFIETRQVGNPSQLLRVAARHAS